MNYLDVIICIFLILTLIGGLRDGLILSVFSLAAIIGGVYGAMYFSDWMGQKLATVISIQEEYLALIGFVIVFIVLVVVISFIGRFLSDLVESLSLGFFDKIGGAIFGVCKGFFFLSLFILLLNFFGLSDIISKEDRSKSLLYPTTEQIANYLYENHDIVKKAKN